MFYKLSASLNVEVTILNIHKNYGFLYFLLIFSPISLRKFFAITCSICFALYPNNPFPAGQFKPNFTQKYRAQKQYMSLILWNSQVGRNKSMYHTVKKATIRSSRVICSFQTVLL